MKKALLLSVLVVGIVLLAVAGWTVDGLRRLARGGGPRPRPAFAR